MRSLVIDDQLPARTLVRCVLESFGDVEEAEAGAEGLLRFEHALEADEPYDLICIDQALSDVSGDEVLTTIRRHEQELGRTPGNGAATVFVITDEHAGDGGQAEPPQLADAYVSRPVSYARLIRAFDASGLEP